MRRLRTIAIAIVAIVAAISVIYAAAFVYRVFQCGHFEQPLSTGHRADVVWTADVCGVLGSSLTDSLEMRFPTGERVKFLEYGPEFSVPDGETPVLIWTGRNDLKVYFAKVSYVHFKLDRVRDIRITYAFGAVEFQ
jgi:hypothetical protein